MSTAGSSRRTALWLLVAFSVSGASSLIYQVVWVRQLGLVFGNTIYSASMVTSLFMLGLGAGGLIAGRYADRDTGLGARRLLTAYAALEIAIACAGGALAWSFPSLTEGAAALSSYSQGDNGWFSLSVGSLALRYFVSALVLGPICIAMGATLPLAVRALAGASPELAGRSVAWLYAANTFGAALGCFLVDQLLVPTWGARSTQAVAVSLGLVAAAVAWRARRPLEQGEPTPATKDVAAPVEERATRRLRWMVYLVLFCSGFAALGLEMVWFRILTYALGSDRSAFSLVLTVILVGLFIGATLASRVRARHAPAGLALSITLAAATTLGCLALFDIEIFNRFGMINGLACAVWLCLLPAICLGATFPLANRWLQDSAPSIGRRVAAIYAWHTTGNVLGALATGFVLIPVFGVQLAAIDLAVIALLSVTALAVYDRRNGRQLGRVAWGGVVAGLVIVALSSLQPPGSLIHRAVAPNELTELHVEEGPNYLVVVGEDRGAQRQLFTNGHPMSGTSMGSHRYMRGMAHVPLLLHGAPKRALVICFGVGNTTHAVSLHKSIERLDVADLSHEVLRQARWFESTNHNVLEDERVQVYVGDGRHHLVMTEPEVYDLITLEPPPINFAGMSALYSREFYEVARSRLREGGYMTQWLPVYQVEHEATLAMVRAFAEVFDNALLLLGHKRELILMGRRGGGDIEFDPATLLKRVEAAPKIQAELDWLGLSEMHELVGMIVGGSASMRASTREIAPLSDDRPINEYRLNHPSPTRIPGGIFDAGSARKACPTCPPPGTPEGDRLDTYVGLFAWSLASDAYLGAPGHIVRGDTYGLPPPPGKSELIAKERVLVRHFADVEALRVRAAAVSPAESLLWLKKVAAIEEDRRSWLELSAAYERVGNAAGAAFCAKKAAQAAR